MRVPVLLPYPCHPGSLSARHSAPTIVCRSTLAVQRQNQQSLLPPLRFTVTLNPPSILRCPGQYCKHGYKDLYPTFMRTSLHLRSTPTNGHILLLSVCTRVCPSMHVTAQACARVHAIGKACILRQEARSPVAMPHHTHPLLWPDKHLSPLWECGQASRGGQVSGSPARPSLALHCSVTMAEVSCLDNYCKLFLAILTS